MPCNVPQLVHTMPCPQIQAGSVCGLGSDTYGVHVISVAARSRTAARSGALAHGLAKILGCP